MEAIKNFGISICTVLIVASLISMIAPTINKKNIIKILISAFILSSMLYSVFKLINNNDIDVSSSFSFEISGEEYEEIEYSDKIITKLEECAVNALYPMISEKLKKYNISQFGIKVSLDEEKNGVSIKCVNIIVPELHINNIDVVLNEIENELGLDVELNVLKLEGH